MLTTTQLIIGFSGICELCVLLLNLLVCLVDLLLQFLYSRLKLLQNWSLLPQYCKIPTSKR